MRGGVVMVELGPIEPIIQVLRNVIMEVKEGNLLFDRLGMIFEVHRGSQGRCRYVCIGKVA